MQQCKNDVTDVAVVLILAAVAVLVVVIVVVVAVVVKKESNAFPSLSSMFLKYKYP